MVKKTPLSYVFNALAAAGFIGMIVSTPIPDMAPVFFLSGLAFLGGGVASAVSEQDRQMEIKAIRSQLPPPRIVFI